MRDEYVALEDLIKSISKTHQFNKEKLIFLNTSDVHEGKILINKYSLVTDLKGQAKKTIQNGDILYSEIRPKNRRYAYVKNIANVEDYVVSTKLMVLRNISNRLDTDYLYHFLTFSGTVEYLQQRAENRIGSFPQITFDVLKVVKIWLPDLRIQKRIAKVLNDLDAKNELNNQINEELQSMTKLIYDYWFIQFDFPMSKEYAKAIGKPMLAGKPYRVSGGAMVYNEQLKREIPEVWRVKELSSVVELINRGISPKYSEKVGIPVINQKCIRNKDIDFKLSRLHDFDRKGTSKLIEIEDILINSTGVGTLGRAAIVKWLPEENVTVDSHVTIIRSDTTKINPHYLGFSLIERIREIETLGTGSTGQTELSRKDLERLKVVIPEKDFQEKFAKIIKPINERQALINKEIQQLTELRDWLLPMLMNGQITIKESYNKIEEQLGMAAEEETAYQRNSEFVDSLFGQVNLYKEISAIQLLEEETIGITHGKTGIQKTTSNLQQILKEKRLKNVKFEERPWGMYSETIAENIETNPFLFKHELDSGKSVYRVKPEAKKELQNWIKLEENQQYIQSLNRLLSIYQEPFIKNDIYKIELLNTVYRCMSKLRTDDLYVIRTAMQNWPMIERKYKNKAEKFSEKVTAKMIGFIQENSLI